MASCGRGFSNQQALLALLLVLPIGVLGLGLVVLLIQRQGAVTPTPKPPVVQELPSDIDRSTTIQPLPSKERSAAPQSGLSQQQARAIVEEWLTVKSQIFAPPFNTDLADQVVAAGPLWTDLTKPDGSIQWLKNNNSRYSYSIIRVNRVIRFIPSIAMPSIVVSVTEDSTLHSPKGAEKSSTTNDWVYTLKEESGRWKIWDYRKQ
ncbi:ARC6/PARC6 family protein [Synechococcus sp. UW140]|uniref:ARC6/PARC6 family protein n=1 Tax=Synechococcus sp. UW140 TaxID=368503 RepID=UPI000E0ECFB4|nr:ARC6/PARC6 family protein [Synechococcus sp. UW140]